jgi:hypothetical protein
MAEKTLFDELKDVLQDFQTFLHDNVATIRPAIQAIASLIPQVNDLIDLLLDLMGKLKTAINELDVSAIPGVGDVAEFTGKIPALLDAAKKLLPDESSSIDAIGDVADVVTGLPSVEDVKATLIQLIDAITADLSSLKA